jgi:transposase-like protein
MSSLSERRSRRRRWSAEEKAAYLAAFHESGLSGAAFCRDSGIPQSTFELWKREVRRDSSARQHLRRRLRRSRASRWCRTKARLGRRS